MKREKELKKRVGEAREMGDSNDRKEKEGRR
jgi:hypothetical protein